MKKIQNILNFLYPEVCFWCENISKENPCRKCKTQIEKISKFSLCQTLDGIEYAYLFKYEDKIRQKIIDYKFNEKPYLKNGFVNLFLQNDKMKNFIKKFDIIIPVPMHNNKKKQRGYNQTEIIAKNIAKGIENLNYEKNILKKKIDNKQQSTLNRKNRMENVKDVYIVCNNKKIIDKNILLFDDIYTTGSTIKECSKILKNVGAKNVGAIVIAKD